MKQIFSHKDNLWVILAMHMGPVGIRRLYEVRTSYRRPLDVQRTSDAHWEQYNFPDIPKVFLKC